MSTTSGDPLRSLIDPRPDPQHVDPEWFEDLESLRAVEIPGSLAEWYGNEDEE
jgi:hypothetical protein